MDTVAAEATVEDMVVMEETPVVAGQARVVDTVSRNVEYKTG